MSPVYNLRLTALQKKISSPILIKKKENLLYLTGHSFIQGWLLVRKDDAVFLGDGLEKIEGVKRAGQMKKIGEYIRPGSEIAVEDTFTFAEASYIRGKIPRAKIKPGPSRVDVMRQVKDSSELKLLARSAGITSAVWNRTRKALKSKSFTEASLARFIASEGLRLGAEAVSFDPIIAAGSNAAVPHHRPSHRRLKKGESVIIDFGFKYRGYCSDFTRTIFLKSVPPKLERAYNQVDIAHGSCIAQARPGIPADRLYREAIRILSEKGLENYFIHGLGHGTGLEIHELPSLSPGSKDVLAPGMVFSIEPGVYFKALGGIRIEDLVYLPHSEPFYGSTIRGLPRRGAPTARKFFEAPTKLTENIL